MSPLDAFWHLANFFAPAWCVAVLLASACKLLWRHETATTAWLRLVKWGGVGGSLGLIAALVLLGADGKISGYALMLFSISLPQWWLALRPKK